MGTTTETIEIRSRDDSKRGVNSAKRNFNDLSRISAKAKAGIAGIAGAAGITALARLTKQTLNAADEIEKLSRRSGASARFLSEMRLSLSQNDVTMTEFNTSLRKINKSSQDAADGLSTPKRAFEKLGISVDDFNKLNSDEKFITLSEAISKVKDPAVRTQAAMDIMGRSGTQLLTVMENGAQGITQYRQEAEAMGLSLSENQVQGAAAANDAIDKLTQSITGSISQAIIPYTDEIARAADFTREFLPKAIEFLINVFRGLKVVVQTVVLDISERLLSVVEIAEKIPGVGDKFKGLGDTLRGVSESMRSQISDTIGKMQGLEDSTDEAASAQSTAADIAARTYVPALRTVAQETATADDATTRYEAKLVRFEGSLDDVEQEATLTADKLDILRRRIDDSGDPTGRLTAMVSQLEQSLKGATAELTEAERVTKRYEDEIASFRDEVAFTSVSADLLADKIQILRDEITATGDPTGELAVTLKDLETQTLETGAASDTVTTTIKDQWEDARSKVFDSLQGFFRDGLDGWDSFRDSIKDIFGDLVSSLLATWARSGLQSIFSNLFGGGGSGGGGLLSGILGGGGSGGGGLLSGILGGGSGGGGLLSGILGGGSGGGGLLSGILGGGGGGGLLGSVFGSGGAIGGLFASGGVFGAGGAAITALGGLGTSLLSLAGPVGIAAAAFFGLRELFGGGARSFSEIVQEDYIPGILGLQQAGEFLGEDGAQGFDGGNTAAFGANFGIQGTGITAQLLNDGGENGNGGFFTGALQNLEEFADLLERNGIEAKVSGGVLRALSRDGTQSAQDIKNLWQEYANGITEAVAFTDVYKTASENNLIRTDNLFFENFAAGFAQNAFEARDSLLTIRGEMDILTDQGVGSTQALTQAFSTFYGLTEQETLDFFSQAGISIDGLATQFDQATDASLRELLDFNGDGLTALESLVTGANNAANDISTAFTGAANDSAAEFLTLEDAMTTNLTEIVTQASAANDEIVINFEATRDLISGSWEGVNLGTLAPIEVPTIEVPAVVSEGQDDQHLGSFNQGGRFIVPGTGNQDQPFRINLTPGEEVTVKPKGERTTGVNGVVSGAVSDDELKNSVMTLVKKIDKLTKSLDLKKSASL